jgi:hypothetical protein
MGSEVTARVVPRRALLNVIPGRHAVANPESMTTDREYGFRAPACGRPRNDAIVFLDAAS